jgi:hypothetical protein
VFLKALLMCEDVRFEQAGTLSLVGVYRENVGGIAVADGIRFAKLFGVAMVGGLAGLTEVQHRWSLRGLDVELASRERPYASEPRDPAADEHVFLFGNAPLVFPAPGRYELVLDVIAMGERATYRYGVRVDAIG